MHENIYCKYEILTIDCVRRYRRVRSTYNPGYHRFEETAVVIVMAMAMVVVVVVVVLMVAMMMTTVAVIVVVMVMMVVAVKVMVVVMVIGSVLSIAAKFVT